MFHPYDTIRQHEDMWDLFTRKEEYAPRQLDQYGRFVYAQSTNQDILEPTVSKYLIDSGFEVEYPDNKQFAVCLTHDVDEIYPPSTHILLSSLTCLRELDFRGFLRQQAFWRLHEKEKSPYWNFQEIMDLEEKYEARSSFYFLASDMDIKRFRYNIEDLEEELGQIVDRGGEVGLHGGYFACNDLEEIQHEKERLERALGRTVTGYRNHYLRFKVPDTWENLSNAGFKYDSTLGYADANGFRNGMCHPFKPYNLNTKKFIDIFEFPIIIMDGTLFQGMKTFEQTWMVARDIIDTIEKYHGVLTVNWHSNDFNCPFKRQWVKLYEKILDYSHTKNGWLTNGDGIFQWWNNESGRSRRLPDDS